jgi:OOP family OmpA-OmpF porin
MERAGDSKPAGNPANGAGELAELRSLLIGQDLEQIAGLQHRLDDPAVRAAETAAVLPGAIKGAPGKGLREALEPLFERLFRNSVVKHPQEISDAIYPVMGPAIRSYVAAAIREFAESLNQVIEKSVSWRSLRWRFEARVTGRPFSEILLSRSLLYSVEQVFLIHRKSGLLLQHVAAETAVVKDADMVSGMFTAIQDFVSDSFTEAGQELEEIDVGRHKLWIQYGPKALLVGAVSGTAPVQLKTIFRAALDRIHQELYAPLSAFKQGDLSVFEPARPHLESCLLGRKTPEKRRRFGIWILLAAAVSLIVAWAVWQVSNQRRWDAYIDALKQQPGIVVVRADRSGSGGSIEGLKDPQAPDPAALLPNFKLESSQVRYVWEPFLSLNTPFAAAREVDADVSYIQRQIIRFEVGSARLALAQAGAVDELTAAINRVHKARPAARIEITGHTDEVGSAADNAKLSIDRATTARDALAAQGVPPELLETRGVGNTQPVRTGATDWDKAANRCVSFRVGAGPAPGR